MEWKFNEMLQVGADHADIDRARNYDRKMEKVRNYKQQGERLVEALKISKEHTIIDFGCGTGALSIELAKRCRRVYAVDVSKPMLEIVKEKAELNGLSNIDYINSGFLNYVHIECPVDIIVTKGALHHLPDFWKVIALSRLGEMLKEDGMLFLSDVIFSFAVKDYTNEVNKFLDGIKSNIDVQMYKDAILHIKEEFSTFDWIMDEMLVKAGFEIVKKEYKSTTNIDYMCIKKKT